MCERRLAYCTNVHAGATLEQTLANLDTHAVAVRRLVAPDATLGVGLWLSARAAREAIAQERVDTLRDFLAERGLAVFTINGFPYGDFHRDVVKHAVYEPSWFEPERVEYTVDLALILSQLLGDGETGSISTLPIGWRDLAGRSPAPALTHVLDTVARLERLAERSGRLIHLDLEPEPGCLVEDSAGLVAWLDLLLEAAGEHADRVRRHLRVCHDVCHAAVMHDDQAAALERWRQCGLKVGKVQLSSAVRVDLDAVDPDARAATLEALAQFREPRYLHQTTIRRDDGVRFHEDLPAALAAESPHAGGEWRVHFHVPIDLERIGPLATTRDEIDRALQLLADEDVHHFEIETYAWDVLPEPLRAPTLAEGIAREIDWLRGRAGAGYFTA